MSHVQILKAVARFFLFFLNGKYIIDNNQVSAQDEQKPVNEELQNKGAVYIRNTNEIPKQTPPNRDL
jgi:hypothetical protein